MRFDFPTIMVLLVFASGGIWAFDAALLAPRRRLAAAQLGEGGEAELDEPRTPTIVEYARSFFPVFLIVFALRSFLVEPFRIPSGSMMPTLLIGDFILVNKYRYGIRLPVLDKKIIDIGYPERGDVVVFRYPEDTATPFIKRVVGLPGDRITYRDKTVYINGEPAGQRLINTYTGEGSGYTMTGARLLEEDLGEHEHLILARPGASSRRADWTVPEGHYFVLGDNRDNSRDSRFWGFVPDELLIGRAFTIWMNWDGGVNWKRIGQSIE